MKFLCGNCKAKYQIADEKASGKTLRMKCRRCGHDILIDGHNVSSSSAPPPAAAAPRRPASVVPSPARAGSGATALPSRPSAAQGLPPRPAALRSKPPAATALGTEFRRHVAAPPEVPQRTAPYDLWHVAIKDVPVGPMTREELGRKIEAGAVTEDSLCWREGMDDWRPLGELPELSQLLRRSRDSARSRPPPRHRPPLHAPPHHAPPHHAPPHPPPQGSRAPSVLPVEEELEEDYSEPTRIADASQGMASLSMAPHAGGTSPKIALAPQLAQPVAPAIEPPVRTVARPGLSGLGYLAIGLLGGILLVAGPMLYKTFWGGGPTASATQPVAQQPVAPVAQQPVAAVTREIPVEVPSVAPEVPKEPESIKPGTKPTGTASTGTRGAKTETKEGAGKDLSEQERALLARMGAAGSGGDIKLDGQRPRETEETANAGPSLTPQQLSKAVQDNKVQLQRCYETALRAAGGRQDAAIKVTVEVTVGGSGTVKGVSTQGTGLGNMNDCIKTAVRRWRFPQSGGESTFAFPLVFQPGA
jgi:predicted Zn finger-like uncharacterized protein